MAAVPLVLGCCGVPSPSIAREAELLAVGKNVYEYGDKFGDHAAHTYALIYADHLAPMRFEALKFLEIGLGCDMPRSRRKTCRRERKAMVLAARFLCGNLTSRTRAFGLPSTTPAA